MIKTYTIMLNSINWNLYHNFYYFNNYIFYLMFRHYKINYRCKVYLKSNVYTYIFNFNIRYIQKRIFFKKIHTSGITLLF